MLATDEGGRQAFERADVVNRSYFPELHRQMRTGLSSTDRLFWVDGCG